MGSKSWPEVKHWDWVEEAGKSLHKVLDLERKGLLPKSISVMMVSTPAQRVLRGVYGGHWAIVWALFKHALHHTYFEAHGVAWRFWHYTIRRRTMEEMLARLDEQDEAELREARDGH